MQLSDVRLSVLDTAPIVEGSTARDALHNAVDLARLADELGYHRYWVPEHHGMRGVASTDPAVLATRLADATANLWTAPGACCCRTTLPCWWPNGSAWCRRCIPAGWISGSAAQPVVLRQ